MTGVEKAIGRRGLAGRFKFSGRPCRLPYGALDRDRQPSQYRPLFLQETNKGGLLKPSLAVSHYSHTDETSMPSTAPWRFMRRHSRTGWSAIPPSQSVYRCFNRAENPCRVMDRADGGAPI